MADDLEPGADRAFGVVLVCLRIAEIGENPVAEMLRDRAVVLRNRLGDMRTIDLQDFAQLLRVEDDRNLGRAEQIAEHHCKLSTLAGSLRAKIVRRRNRIFSTHQKFPQVT